jgi:hypothetical protein
MFSDVVRFEVSSVEVDIETASWTGTIALDGSETRLSDGRTSSASLDAGWLMVTMRRERGDNANVMREAYVVLGDDLTIWRTLNVERADGTQGKIDCGNRTAIVYTRASP